MSSVTLGVAISSYVWADKEAENKEAADFFSLEKIIVTATRLGATKAQSTPLALSVFSESRLNDSAATNIKDLVQFTPSLNVAAESRRMPICARVVYEVLGTDINARAALKMCGLFSQDSGAISPDVKRLVKNTIDEGKHHLEASPV